MSFSLFVKGLKSDENKNTKRRSNTIAVQCTTVAVEGRIKHSELCTVYSVQCSIVQFNNYLIASSFCTRIV